MSELVAIMAAPFVACIVLTGIHAYLGLHVLARGVIFVDLALAQVAALGASAALLLGHEPDSAHAYVLSMAFALGGAALFALTRTRDERIPQEAFIGIVYAVASAAGILLVDRAPHGSEHLKAVLVGQILWVGWPDVARLAVIFAVVGAVHAVYRTRFLLLSTDGPAARAEGLRVRWWDFLFYASFALVITFAVQVAGVLLVFSFLIVPAVIGMLFHTRLRAQLITAWGVGAATALAGGVASYTLDLPTGAAIVCTFGLVLAAAVGLRRLLPS